MLQYLIFNSNLQSDNTFRFIDGASGIKYFVKKFFVLFLIVYGTFFLAVATPFFIPFIRPWEYNGQQHHLGFYFIGLFIFIVALIRFINAIIKYGKFSGSSLIINQEGLHLSGKTGSIKIAPSDIKVMQRTISNNLAIFYNNEVLVLPLALLSSADRNSLLELFVDSKPERTSVLQTLWGLGDAIVVALFLAIHIIQFGVQNFYIPSESMEDTLLKHDKLLAEKITYGPVIPQMLFMDKPLRVDFLKIRSIQRGDIIIFIPPGDSRDFIKRCVAIAGDDVKIENGYVYVNGVKQDQPYIKGITDYTNFMYGRMDGKVPEGYLIAMGDNRQNSFDSRGFGYVPVERIKGRAWLLYWNGQGLRRYFNHDISDGPDMGWSGRSRYGFIK